MAMAPPTFHVADYLVFACMLAVSASIGIFYAVSSRRQASSGEYMLASRQMGFFPVAMSLLASLFTGVYIQGSVAETYYRGAIFLTGTLVPLVIAGIISGRIFLPKFYEMRLTSVYQYVELRFNVALRNLCLVVGYIYMILHSGVATFAAGLVLTTVTQGRLSLFASAVILSIVCTFYTVIGGIKAVLWADCFQMCLVFTALLAAIIQGATKLGYREIWQLNLEGGRLDLFDFNPDPRIYATFWTVLIGGIFSWFPSMSVLQYQVQRYLTCKTQNTAHMSFGVFVFGCVCLTVMCVLSGMSMYALYVDCDPYTSGALSFADGLLPFYIIDVFSSLPGVPGLLVSGLCSAALSTTSSILNSIATITNEHIISKIWTDLPDLKYLLITKVLVVCFGALNIATVLLVSQLGAVLPAIVGIIGITNGPVSAVFILGFIFPRANAKGTIVGFVVGFAIGLWVFIASLFYQPPPANLPLSVDECPLLNASVPVMMTTLMSEALPNVTTAVPPAVPEPSNPFIELYKVSRLWYPTLCIVLVVVIGIVASLIFDVFLGKPKVNPALLWNWKRSCCCCVYKQEERTDDEKNLFSEVLSDVTTVENGEPAGVVNAAYSIGDPAKSSPAITTHL